MIKLALLAYLLVAITSNNKVQVTCGQCSGGVGVCKTYSGGPFNNTVLPTLSTSCDATFPIIYDFSCSPGCSGCLITVSKGGQPQSTCSDTPSGVVTVQELNAVYIAKLGVSVLNTSYDWCNCGVTPTNQNGTSGVNATTGTTVPGEGSIIEITCAQKGNNFF